MGGGEGLGMNHTCLVSAAGVKCHHYPAAYQINWQLQGPWSPVNSVRGFSGVSVCLCVLAGEREKEGDETAEGRPSHGP